MKGGGRTAGMITLLALGAFGGACKQLDPETGDLRPTCDDADSNPAVAVDFRRDIRPLMNGKVEGTKGCLLCHAPAGVGPAAATMEGFNATGLDLSKLQTLRRGGANTAGVIVVPGKPCDSAIVQKLQGTFSTGGRMPKNGPFWDASKIQLVRDWIAEGAQGADE